MMRFPSLFLLFVLFSVSVKGQLFPPHPYPQNYFQWPTHLEPGIVANFGELRPNHYHMGLDVRTDGKVNVPVYAAAEGYVAKVHIDPTGFGRALYLNHPNGLTTLYAHLNNFNPALEKYTREQQYKLKQWKIDLELPKDLFPVNKDDFIAYSGNTGGSQGPHVHFEIRETKSDKVLNPLLFGLPIPDTQAPDIIRLALYDRRISTLEQSPKIFPLKKTNGIYAPAGGLLKVNSNKISFAISAFDRYTGSTNQNGIYSAVLFFDNKPVTGFQMNGVSYDETRTLNGHIDFRMKSHGGPFLQHVSPLPGCMDVIYNSAPGEDGIIRLNDDKTHEIKIEVSDVAGNKSLIRFNINTNDNIPSLPAADKNNLFEPDLVNIYEENNLLIHMPVGCIFDAFHFRAKAIGNGYLLSGEDIPVNNYFSASIHAEFPIEDTGKIIMKMRTKEKDRFKKAAYEQGGWYKASFRDLGLCELIRDLTPPSVIPLFGFHDGIRLTSSKIGFAVSDNTKEIESLTGLLDGQWILFSNDKGKSFIYDVDQYCGNGEHFLKLIVKDLAGNITEKNYHFYK